MYKSIKLLSFVLFALAANLSAQTVISQQKWHKNNVSLAGMDQRISDAAEKFKQYGQIPKIAFYDIGYPKDEKEFDELNGYGFLLIVALAQDEKNLPLKRVFVAEDGKVTELKLVKSVLSKSADTESLVYKTFGSFRMDALYAFPVYLRMKKGDLISEFGLGGEGLKMASFDGRKPLNIKILPDKMPTESGLPDAASEKFIKENIRVFLKIENAECRCFNISGVCNGRIVTAFTNSRRGV